ncbi:uncharacterized protein HMPREF1541_00657 [Cyphellophora europaea CBS 101466]|uniref:Uncharacterized protein n=1 Tax=Cyphellophora europaea (strain CBS 101466) TaxID=1220924 RepID=W2SCQ4_CYPE1|nr:uncharacterized protein HMPREF1541_00657 [Cyphellophora europaea CBS 101466]ETN46472.1 hypothetical protein HMPREF1541_00657 [Cyphellophora europaea CBS 101466]
MFNRAPRVAHICLRCQRNLARKSPGWPTPQPSIAPGRGFIRHQSAAVARSINDDDDYHEPEPIHTQIAPHESITEASIPVPPRTKSTRYRRLRRTPTAGLNIETLGKPSEIILLPSHDRVIPESVQAEDGPRQNLSEALESEKVPVSWEQVKEHIESTRSKMREQRGQLDTSEWTKLAGALKRGFSKMQLRRFLKEQTQGPSPTIPPDSATRPQLAALIATNVWGYQLPQEVKQSLSDVDSPAKEKPPKPQASYTQDFTNHSDVLLMQHDPSYGFRSLTSQLGVKVSVAGSKVTVQGDRASVKRAEKWLLSRKPRLKNINVEGFGESMFADDRKKNLSSLLQDLSAEYGVVASRHPKGAGMNVRYMQANRNALVSIRRDLRLLTEDNCRPSFMASARPERVKFAPYFTVDPAPWPTEAAHWGRGFDTVAVGSTGMTKRAETSAQIEDHWESLKKQLDSPISDTPLTEPNSLRCEFHARFGMNLYAMEPMPKYTGLSIPKQESLFVDEVPLLAQLFVNSNFQERPSPPAASDIPTNSPLVLRLLLRPVQLSSKAPSLEIYVYGQDPTMGLRQTLNVARISALINEQVRNISLPTLPVDISFTRQLKQDLFVQRSPSTSQHPTLLQSIGQYLSKARKTNAEEPNFFYFADFIIPDNFILASETGEIEYVLSSVETVNTDSRLTPDLGYGSTRMTMEHLVFGGGKWGSDRQELRISQVPLLAAPPAHNVSLENLRTVTIDVAERFGDMARQFRSRMEAVK